MIKKIKNKIEEAFAIGLIALWVALGLWWLEATIKIIADGDIMRGIVRLIFGVLVTFAMIMHPIDRADKEE